MKKLSPAVVCIMYCINVSAQSTIGITHKPDTSYSTYSAYISSKKTNPDIEIAPEYRSESITEERNIAYCNTGNRDLYLDVFYPKKKTKIAGTAILIIHGGGWRSGNRAQHYPLAQHLAALGYICFTPEYRLSTEALYPSAVNDLKSALRWMRANANKYNIDTAKMVALGFSAGGELAAFLGVTNNTPDLNNTGCTTNYSANIQAIIDLDGTLSFVHPESGEGDDRKSTSAATYWFGYSKKDNPGLWKDASPLEHVDGNTPPVLFINSSVSRMHAGREDFIKMLEKYKTYAEVKNFPDAPHSFPLFKPWFDVMVGYINTFLMRVFENR